MTDSNYVAGAWRGSESGRTTESRNPADPDEIVGELAESTVGDATDAIDAAVEAQETWASTPGPERGAILRRTGTLLAERKDEVTETLVREEGKTWSEAAGEVQRAIDIFHYYAGKAADLRAVCA